MRMTDVGALADAFSQFIDASSRLESSYRDLQAEVAELSHELADRNAALRMSLDENERMRRALEQIVASMPCGVLVVEGEIAVRMINPEAVRLLGLESSVQTLTAVKERTGLDLQVLGAVEGETEFCVTVAPEKRWLTMRTRRTGSAAPAGGVPDERAAQTILILSDSTAHKQAQMEREAARRAISLAEIAAILAHEIRNPLAALELFAGLIAGEAAPAGHGGQIAEWVGHLQAGIRTLGGTVNNVLSLHGPNRLVMTPLRLGATIAAAVEFTRPLAEQSEVGLRCWMPERELTVNGNAGALRQLVLNLVTNAVRHTAEGGAVGVSVSAMEDGKAAVVIRDTGCGIAPEHLPELFRPGFSGTGSTSGLGLAVCRQIAEEHGGVIRVQSQQGLGTTFWLELPTVCQG